MLLNFLFLINSGELSRTKFFNIGTISLFFDKALSAYYSRNFY